MIFDYLRTVQSLDTITIEDIGNTCINTINDDAEEWYLIITTKQGWTEIKEFGPLVVDSDKLKQYFMYNKFSFEYNEKRLRKIIDNFINNTRHNITQVFEIEKSDAENRLNISKKYL